MTNCIICSGSVFVFVLKVGPQIIHPKTVSFAAGSDGSPFIIRPETNE